MIFWGEVSTCRPLPFALWTLDVEEEVVSVLRKLLLEDDDEAALGMGSAADLTGVMENEGPPMIRPSSSEDSLCMVCRCSSLTLTTEARVPVVN